MLVKPDPEGIPLQGYTTQDTTLQRLSDIFLDVFQLLLQLIIEDEYLMPKNVIFLWIQTERRNNVGIIENDSRMNFKKKIYGQLLWKRPIRDPYLSYF
jgi:hypothetical protein